MGTSNNNPQGSWIKFLILLTLAFYLVFCAGVFLLLMADAGTAPLVIFGFTCVIITVVIGVKRYRKLFASKPDSAPTKTAQPRQRRSPQAQPAAKSKQKATPRQIQEPEPEFEPEVDFEPESEFEPEPEPADWNTYFKTIIANWFPNLTIAEDVPVTQVTGDIFDIFKLYKTRPNQAYKAEWGKPYSLVLYSEGAPRCIIMLVNQEDRPSQKVKYLISKMFAQKMNIPYLYFYTDMENEELYCIKRIREAMK